MLEGGSAIVTNSTSGIGLGIAAFLRSKAAAQIRGIGLPVDGGWTAQ
jgi:NAD(P)-dependent dehydrogenase (short-subunit alcohol dehydrogenase family)